MSALIDTAYLWIKWIHIMAVISWMAGLFYLPRLFVHHVESAPENANAVFEMMELKLLKIIMTPAMLVTWITGILLIVAAVDVSDENWIFVKIFCVFLMTGFHGFCGKWRKELASGKSMKSGKFFRVVNEIPTLLMIVIVGMVVFKPF